ncbi:hypothetical protein DL98DRAFT_585339 [Cadophora sp. DSE1049]|nr:hypothetical protein DL98DRAFT_585339 [Cadophora sp. DSE1049]
MPPVQSTLNTAFSGASTATVNLFANADCTTPFQLAESPTTILIDTCHDVESHPTHSQLPLHHSKALSSPTFTCSPNTSQTGPDCSSPHISIPLDPLAPDTCLSFTSSIDCSTKTETSAVKSLKVVCRPVEKEEEETETNILESPPPPRRGKRGNDVSVGVNANCCKACVVM